MVKVPQHICKEFIKAKYAVFIWLVSPTMYRTPFCDILEAHVLPRASHNTGFTE